MLKQYFAVLLTMAWSGALAQNNLIVLTEKGSLFTLFVNDKQINDSAQSVAEARNIYEDSCMVKLVFADKALPAFTGSAFLTIAGKSVRKREFTYSLAEEKGKSKLQFISVNLTESDTTVRMQLPEKRIRVIFAELERRKDEENRLKENYPPPGTCAAVVPDSVLTANLKLLRDNHIELNRMKDAKWFVSHRCLTTTQLKQVMDTFDRQDGKVEIAEFSYAYLQQPADFLQVLDAVRYVTEKEDLKKFYEQQTKK